MGRRKLLRQLLTALLSITVLVLLAAGWEALALLRDVYYRQASADLEVRASLVEAEVPRPLSSVDTQRLAPLVHNLSRTASARITVIAPGGKVLADSEQDPARMDNHADRPEVMAALSGRRGSSVRYSHTLEQHMMYVAVPLRESGRTAGVVRAAVPVGAIDRALDRIRDRMLLGGGLLTVLAAIAGLIVFRRLARPWEEMQRAAERFAGGDLEYRVPAQDSEEARGLAAAMNDMAGQLGERVRDLAEQHRRQETLLSSMVEGVLAVDGDERLITLNPAAGELFGVHPEEVRRRSVPEAIRNPGLQRFVRATLAGDGLTEGEIIVREGGERYLQAHGTVLRNGDGKRIGALIVLNDVTRLRRLEKVRRDFVANVSHELKTPITAIKGFVETIREGALGDPADAERFLGIIAKQADRLDAIIEDLLTLSRIEQEAERAEIALEVGSVREVLEAAVQDCRLKAEERNVRLVLSAPDDLLAPINHALLEQAVVNLIDNAIKYSDPGSMVEVEAVESGGEVAVRVRDYGPGIDAEHLPRLFERFYRADKARSRKVGGTGLGLAIVKHITQAHGGRVAVESVRGQGSAFSLHLPIA
jgi:two-component system phosphate regulon sensor histidine kinase PhoR